MFNIIDLFCGTGAISYGLKSADDRFKVLGGIDMDPSACSTARANHPDAIFVCDSIESTTPKKFSKLISAPKIDMIVGGPPCQGFSSLRPNRQSNINDPRNRLYKYFLDFVRYFEPNVVLMENVVGLLSASNGRLLSNIVSSFQRLGYTVDWRVINAANYGVPQKRERVIFVATNNSLVKRPTLNFPEPTHFFNGRVIGTRFKSHYIHNPKNGVPALTVNCAISDLPEIESGQTATSYWTAPQNSYQKARRKGNRKLSLHEAASHSAKMIEVMKLAGGSKLALPRGLVSSGFSSCYSRMDADEPATTITVKFTSPSSSKCIHPWQNRAITPREAARIQGFDDSFVFRGSKTEIASQIGNAVPPLLGAALAPMFVEHIEASNYAF